ncbi:MAG TPA: family 16 glycoside hydrolase [Chthoniobacter sp.]
MTLASACSKSSEQPETFEPRTMTFASNEAGKLPPDFSTELTGGGGPISWVLREDPTAPGGGKTLVQESADDTSYRFPLCIYDPVVARDVAVEVSYKAIAGKVDQAGGIVLRYNPENYYIARANALEDNIDLFMTVRGKRVKIEEVPVKVTPHEWHTLRFEAKGPHLKVAFDGKTVIEKDDSTFPSAGKVGLWTKADSVSAFTNLKIEPLR